MQTVTIATDFEMQCFDSAEKFHVSCGKECPPIVFGSMPNLYMNNEEAICNRIFESERRKWEEVLEENHY